MSDNSQRPCDQARYCAPSLHSEPMSDQAGKFPFPSRAELRRVALAAAALIAFTCLPYLWGWLLRPADFMGHVYNADDPNVHLAWMRQAAEGRWLFTDRFTSEEQQPQFFHLFYLVLGKVAGLFGDSYRVLICFYHLARVVGGWLFLMAAYLLAAYIYPDARTRWLGFWTVALSSGLGFWLDVLLGKGDRSCDYGPGLLMPEAITFLSLYLFPLFAVSILVLVCLYLLVLRAFDTGRVAPAVGAGLFGLVLGNIHSYDLLPVYAVLAVYVFTLGIARRAWPLREIFLAAIVVAISLPAPAYQYLVFRSNPIFQQKALTPTLSPSVVNYALTYGLVLVAACVGAWHLRHRPHRCGDFLITWFIITLAMAYLPVSFQRKMIEGAHIPLALLAAPGWHALTSRVRLPGAVATALWIALVIPSNLGLMADSIRRLENNNAEGVAHLLPAYYLDSDQRAVLEWLRQNGRPEDVVLSSPLDGCYMPPYCGVTTYVSHWAETIDVQRKLANLRGFLASYTADEWRIRFLREERIRYYYHGPAEAAMGAFDPSGASYLRLVCQSGPVALYEVVLP
ncbi:MAG TPA: hypothetical protein GX715_12355 [Armatimonadetes bacterium]|nr:hypothetical protein [Armatimonadota bacterium]